MHSKKKPKLFWVSAIVSMVLVVIGCLFAYFAHAEKHVIQIVGDLKKRLNPISIKDFNFDPAYLSAVTKADIISGILALTEGIAIGRNFAMMKNQQIDGNKEIIAFGLMKIVGSMTFCYLSTGGEWCDNMTMILVQFKKTIQSIASSVEEQSLPSKQDESEPKLPKSESN